MSNAGKLIFFLILSCLALQLYADPSSNNTCAPKQATLTLGDKHYQGVRNITQNVTKDVARIVWVTLDSCPDGYVTITEVNSTNSTSTTHKGRVEHFSEFINVTIKKAHFEGQYTRYSHIAELVNIKPATLYLANITSGGESTSFRFKIPDMNNRAKPLTFLFYADFDNGNISKPTFARLRNMLSNDSNEIDFSLFNGDLAYDIVSDAGLKGDSFYEDFQSIATTRPMVLAPGNHEEYYNFTLLNYRSKMPLFNETNNHYYSWDMGLVHFITFNYDFYDYLSPAEQTRMYNWVANDLEAANATENRTQRPWIIVYTHRPIYCSTNLPEDKDSGRCYSFYKQRKIWDELLYKYRVDLLFAGHVHSYDRMGAIARNQSMSFENLTDSNGCQIIKNPTATVHVIDGAAGNDYFMQQSPIAPASYSIKTDINIGFSIITVHNDSTISFQHVKSSDGSIIDQFILHRDRPVGWPIWATILIVLVGISVIGVIIAFVYFKTAKKGKQEVSDLERTPSQALIGSINSDDVERGIYAISLQQQKEKTI